MGDRITDVALVPLRLIGRAFDDVHRLAHAAESIGEAATTASNSVGSVEQRIDEAIGELARLREQIKGVNASVESLPGEARRVATSFDRSNDEAERIRSELSTLIEHVSGASCARACARAPPRPGSSHGLQRLGQRAEHVVPLGGDRDQVLDAHADAPRDVDARLHGDHMPGTQRIVAGMA